MFVVFVLLRFVGFGDKTVLVGVFSLLLEFVPVFGGMVWIFLSFPGMDFFEPERELLARVMFFLVFAVLVVVV